MSIQYPKEIREFHDQLGRLPGVYDIISGINSLHGVTELTCLCKTPRVKLARFWQRSERWRKPCNR